MSLLQQLHHEQVAKLVSDAAERGTYFDKQMARAKQEAGSMQLAFDKLTSEYAEHQKTSALVSVIDLGAALADASKKVQH